MNIEQEFEKNNLFCGRRISGNKISPKGQTCVWNANIIIKSQGKVWFGDINLTQDGEKLKKIATDIGEPLYVLKEKDCRFDTASNPVEELISRAVWSTE